MKLLFLGTGAADWAIKPEEETSFSDRRRSAMTVDEHILIDIGPQTYQHAKRLGVDLTKITDILISHTHSDHYNKAALLSIRKDCGHSIRIHCHKDAVPQLALCDEEQAQFELCPLEVGENRHIFGCKLTALAANHLVEESNETPLHYILDVNGKHFFYGCDGGWFTAATWEYMRKNCVFDCMILDATVGEMPGNFRIGTHNTFPMMQLIITALKENKMIHDGTLLIANHLAQTLHPSFEETRKMYAGLGMRMAYDRLTIEF